VTTLSFRADDATAEALEREAARAGRSKSDLLSEALRDYLYKLACERDAAVYDEQPLSDDETTPWSNEAWAADEPGTDWDEVFGA
jgi:hypothetical protein